MIVKNDGADNRLALIRVSPSAIVRMSVVDGWAYRCIDGLPEDCRVVRSWYEAQEDVFVIALRSKEFTPVEDAAVIPEREIRWIRGRDDQTPAGHASDSR